MLNEKEIQQIKDELDTCKRPLFFFHDDQDGLASFLLFYRYVKEGKGQVLKAKPNLTELHAKKVEDYGADKVFVLDIAMVDQEFIDQAGVPVIWIDHHPVVQRDNVKYFNPRTKDENLNIPVAYLCYQVVQQDLWIAMVGCLGDWYVPDFIDEFRKKYPDLLPEKYKTAREILFETKMSILNKVFSFNLKGNTSDVLKCIKVMTRIDSPNEILEQSTPKGKLIYKKYQKINKAYEELKETVLKQKQQKGKVMLFKYTDDKLSLTKDLANELLYMFPDRVIVLGREKSGELRCSIRAMKIDLKPVVEKALMDVNGYGGGHEHACGAAIKLQDIDKFISNIEKQVS
ncbi:DHH family phosphoesterase [Candidatus Woesearchaeota archaeon]|nr:DHH family phosphoesterase [Candidatus Woesearchaeota archaeon]MBW3005898.1 DHH family phosphoesterase [Candidatus Woesearchaeota archaeon]